ncbi:hypothetical protein Anas_05794 [Armadillidium nasatum]|uniref:Uncharacterized protein n=1 Tax=Armadillidium nasatum TaxID=96803 RepID=A0A5N5TJI7_9CRUS|nr:hypothetical protein Anas_05794 [Armadillidium nasatum]
MKHQLFVHFNPKDRYLFASGGKDGKVLLNSALTKKSIKGLSVASLNLTKRINGLAFVAGGEKLVVSSESRRMSLVDVERGEMFVFYENSVCSHSARQPVATHSDSPDLVACVTVNGKGITLFDLRMPLPLDFLVDLYDSSIGDLMFLDKSWPWGSGQVSLLSGGGDHNVKITNFGGTTQLSLNTGMSVSALAYSPGRFGASNCRGYKSVILAAGDFISCHEPSLEEVKPSECFKNINGPVLRAKYSCSGGLLYTASERGSICRFRRYPDRHEALEELYSHDGPVTDFDISSYGEYIVSASLDGFIGLYSLGGPSHGNTQCWELT